MKNDVILLLVGASGAGKTTIAKHLCEMYGLTQIESYTTRPRRTKDEFGHIFITDDEFGSLRNLVAYTKFNGYQYGATAKQVDENDIYVIDPAGIDYFRKSYKGNKKAVVVHIDVDRADRMARMISRGDAPQKVFERLLNDDLAFAEVDADYTFENYDDPKSVAEQIYKAVFRGNVI